MSQKNVRRRDRQIVRVLWLLKALGDGPQLILGWGDAVEVIAPESLRESVRQKSVAMSNLYKTAGSGRKRSRR